MKKFLHDNTLTLQKIPVNIAKSIFSIPNDVLDETIEKERFIVLHSYKNENYSVQICFNIHNHYGNNNYLVLLFDNDDNTMMIKGYQSHTTYPPVWNREFGYIDYLDFLGIQKMVNDFLIYNKLKSIDYDFSPEKRCFYFTKETPEEIQALLKENKPYQIISIFADKKPELIEQAKQYMNLIS